MKGTLSGLLGLSQLEEIVNIIDVLVRIQPPEEARECEFDQEDRERPTEGHRPLKRP